MPFSVSIDDEEQTVVLRVWGDAPLSDHSAGRDEAYRQMTARSLRRLLVDLREVSTRRMATDELFAFGASTAGVFPPGCRAALWLPKEIQARGDVMFSANVCHNRGASIAEFDTEAAARQWLARA
jgi:hypothetical protein